METLGSTLGGVMSVTAEERVVVTRLRYLIDAQARSACSEVGIDVETLMRFTRGEDADSVTQERLRELDDFEAIPFVPGLELLADLKRLAS
jgi:hypothetical protein